MAKKKVIPEYGKVKKNGTEYYRTRILDADGKQVDIYGKTCEEVYDRAQAASRAIADAIFRKNNPTVREYCEKWLKMKSATVRPNTLEGYRKLGERCRTNKSIYYTLDFHVTPHLLRHTYITNLIHEGVDPKTVQYLAGHENSKVTMDIYAKVKYNKPWELASVINQAFSTNSEKESA